jgi:hypothetical protein
MSRILDIFLRILAVFSISALSVVGAGAVVHVDPLQTILMAGILGVANVLEELARKYVNDGRLSDDEINETFKKASEAD